MSLIDLELLHDLATCVAWIGRVDPWTELKSFDDNEIEKVTGDEDGPNPSSIRAELPLSINKINEIWNEPFDHICPGSHSEERFFADGDNGGNRVVYLQEFLKKVLPGVYWKIRATGHAALNH